MFYFLLELQVLLWVGHLFELFELLPELHIVIVQLLAFKTDLQSFQLLGSQFGGECFRGEVAGEVLLGHSPALHTNTWSDNCQLVNCLESDKNDSPHTRRDESDIAIIELN